MTFNLGRRRFMQGALAAGASLASVRSTLAQAVDFSGKRIEIIVGGAAGGTSDIVARFIGRGLERELPGNPTILIRNITGGGSIEAANTFDKNAKDDGLLLFYSTPSSILNPLFLENAEQIRFDPSRWKQFMASAGGYINCGSKAGGIDSIDALKAAIEAKQRITMGMSSPIGSALMYNMAMEMLGANLVPAFNVGSAEAAQAFLRGEFMVNTSALVNYNAALEPLVASGEVVPLYTLGQADENGNLIRDPQEPDIPHVGEVYEIIFAKKPEGEAFEVYKVLVDALIANARGVMLPGITRLEIFQAYSEAAERAFKNVHTDPKAIEIVGPIPLTFGTASEARLTRMLPKLTPELIGYLKNLYRTKYNVPI